jgi:NAD(P)-dependent dehydrogenase (short-subunit alcohol dehydrogenase family)
MTTSISDGTVLITGPTSGLGKALALQLANRKAPERPDLLLVGRPGERLTEINDAVRSAGATAEPIPCDLARLADVRAAAKAAKELLAAGAVRPLRALVANAGLVSLDLRTATADGYEKTFAVNYLAHAQLIGDLRDSFATPARIVLVGSNVYRGTLGLRMIGVPGPQWRDPADLARPATGGKATGMKAAQVAYANAKLAILYYAHELQRHVGDQIHVVVFEPGFMPGTGLGREASPAMQRLARAMEYLPGTTRPARSAPAFAAVVLDDRWAHLRDGALIVIDKEIDVLPHACDRQREARLWEATSELLSKATSEGQVAPKRSDQ